MKKFFAFSLLLAGMGLACVAGAVEKLEKAAIVIDVRTPEEYAESHLVGALNLDFKDSSFEAKVKALDKKQAYKLYCRSGNRSGKAEKLMKELGFQRVENIGSVKEASKHLNRGCEGKTNAC